MNALDTLAASDLRALVETGAQLASEIDLHILLARILETAGRLMDSPDGAVLLHDSHRDGLFFASAIGDSGQRLLDEWGEHSAKRVPITGSKAGSVFRSGESLVENALEDDGTHFKRIDAATHRTTQSMVCVPLSAAHLADGGVVRLGAIQVLNKRSGAYTERDRILLESFGKQAAVAIKNARLFRDLLTHRGLYSRGNPQELVERLNRAPEAQELTIMFPDMRGFTQLLQSMHNPAHMHELMSEFLTMLAEETLKFGGVVNKALGDGILAFFGGGDAPRRAVQSAFSMLGRFDHLRLGWNEAYNLDLSFLDLGIGIATGQVSVGTFGSGDMRDFTVMGVPVNLAAAFQSNARHGKRILVDQKTLQGAKDVVEEVPPPTSFKLHKPDQDVFVRYHQYHLARPRVSDDVNEIKTRVEDSAKLRIFLCHSSADKPAVRGLYTRLTDDGFDVWLDEEKLLPGQDWQLEIKKAVRAAHAIVVCLSNSSVSKEGYLQREIRVVLEVADEKPDGTIFVVPAKLEVCDMPDRLERLHYVELFQPNGYDRLKRALESRAAAIACRQS